MCEWMNPKFVKSNAKLHPVPVRVQVWHMVTPFVLNCLRKQCTNLCLKNSFITVAQRGNKCIITLLDYFSKWPEAGPIPDKTALSVANFLFCRSVSVHALLHGIRYMIPIVQFGIDINFVWAFTANWTL